MFLRNGDYAAADMSAGENSGKLRKKRGFGSFPPPFAAFLSRTAGQNP